MKRVGKVGKMEIIESNRKKENDFYCDAALVFICVIRRRRRYTVSFASIDEDVTSEREHHNIRTWIHEIRVIMCDKYDAMAHTAKWPEKFPKIISIWDCCLMW